MNAEAAGIGSCRVFTNGDHGIDYDGNIPFDADVNGIDLFVGQYVTCTLELGAHMPSWRLARQLSCVLLSPSYFSMLAAA
jgi:hypothetical protein